METIQKLTPPTDVTGIKSFLGIVNYFFKFIPCCSVLAEPLLCLKRGKKGSKTKFTWGEDQQASFEALKEHLMLATILSYPDFKKKFFIETDASKVGLGAMLSQSHSYDGISERLPVAYASQSLNETERNYRITDLETLLYCGQSATLRRIFKG